MDRKKKQYVDEFKGTLSELTEAFDEGRVEIRPKPGSRFYCDYEQVNGRCIDRIFAEEKITAVDVHTLYIAVGTDRGRIYLMDVVGNPYRKENWIYEQHKNKILSIKIEDTARYIFSCGVDTFLKITDTIGDEFYNYDLLTIPYCLAVAPNFIQDERIVIAGEDVTIHKFGLLKKKSTVLYANETVSETNIVSCVSWNRSIIAMTSERGTKFFHSTTLDESEFVIHRETLIDSWNVPARHVWLPDGTLIVGWGTTVTIISVDERNTFPNGFYCETIIKLPQIVSALSFTMNAADELELMVIGFDGTEGAYGGSKKLKTYVIWKPREGNYIGLRHEEASDSPIPAGTKPSEIHAAFPGFADFFFIFAPKQMLVAFASTRMIANRFNCEYKEVEGDFIEEIFSKGKKITAVDVHEQYIAIGTDCGKIYLMNHQGGSFLEDIAGYRVHQGKVMSIKIEETSRYVVSCGDDNKIRVFDINGRHNLNIDLTTTPFALAIAPNFINDERVVVAGENLTIYGFRVFRSTIKRLYEIETPNAKNVISCVSWNRSIIAMTSERGTKFFHSTTLDESEFVIHRENPIHSVYVPARHVWLPDGSLIVGWGRMVNIISVDESKFPEGFEVKEIAQIPLLISGISFTMNWANDFQLFIIGSKAIKGTDEEIKTIHDIVLWKSHNGHCNELRWREISDAPIPRWAFPQNIHAVFPDFADFFYIFVPGEMWKAVQAPNFG